MYRLASLLYSLIGSSLAGAFVVVALVAGYDDLQGILTAAALGAVAGLPASLVVARKLYNA
ncbi:MAG: hypothetical protein AAGF71_12795 [Pseudomonadota bacterium]